MPRKSSRYKASVGFTLRIGMAVVILACGAASQTTYVYVGNYGDNTLSGYAVNHLTGTLTAVPGSAVAAGTNPIGVALDQQCRRVFISNALSNNVTGYTIDANTGGVALIPGSPFATGAIVNHGALDRFGRFLYVPNTGLNDAGTTLSAFSINADTGALTEMAGSPFSTGGQGPDFVFVDPSNRYLYVANDGNNTLSGFAINPSTGALTPIPGSPWSSGGSSPRWVTMDNTGQFLYVSNTVSGNVEVFTVDQNTGALTHTGSVSIGFNIYEVAIDLSNKFAYVAQLGSGIFGFSRDANNGLLAPLPGFPVNNESPQGNPNFAFDPAGRFLYIANQNTNTVGVWTLDGSGGLAQIPGSPFRTGSTPSSIMACTADQDQTFASLFGGNVFSGNQTVNGLVSATSFSGNGAGLTGVNALSLGGITAANYARLDIGNSFTGDQSISGNLSVTGMTTLGAGTPILKHLSATFDPPIGPLKPATCTTATFVLSGASDGDTLALGVPNARMSTGVILSYFAWVSASNTITLQACNLGSTPQKTAGTGAIRVDLWKH